LAAKAPAWGRLLRPVVIAWFRVRKLLTGAYRLGPFNYEVFTRDSLTQRRKFEVHNPTQRWPGR